MTIPDINVEQFNKLVNDLEDIFRKTVSIPAYRRYGLDQIKAEMFLKHVRTKVAIGNAPLLVRIANEMDEPYREAARQASKEKVDTWRKDLIARLEKQKSKNRSGF